MELWMKIAMIVVAVMSVLGLTAFIIVLHHVIPKGYYGGCIKPESKKHKFERIDAELGEFNRIVSFTESRLDYVAESVEELTSKVNLDEGDLHEMKSRVNRQLDRLNGIEYGIIPMINDKIDKLKKRVKALEKEKE